jgi:hypothetical protein
MYVRPKWGFIKSAPARCWDAASSAGSSSGTWPTGLASRLWLAPVSESGVRCYKRTGFNILHCRQSLSSSAACVVQLCNETFLHTYILRKQAQVRLCEFRNDVFKRTYLRSVKSEFNNMNLPQGVNFDP